MPNLTFSGPPMNLTIKPDNPLWLWVYFHVFGVISCAINMLSLYCILKKSSKEMVTYKWFLFNIWLWSFIMDWVVMFFIQPISWFPLFGGACAFKYVAHWNKDLLYGFLLLAGALITSCTMSLVAGIFYRWQVLIPYSPFLETPRRTIATVAIIHLSYIIPGAVALWVVRPSIYVDEFIRYHVVNHEQLLEHAYLVLHSDLNKNSMVAIVTFSVGISGVFLACGAMLGDSYRRLYRMKENMISDKSKKMHKQMLLSLLMQAVIPMISYATPTCLACLMILLDLKIEHMQEQTTIMIAVFCTHSTLSCIVLLSSVQCYRFAVIKMFRLEKFFNRNLNIIEVSRSAGDID